MTFQERERTYEGPRPPSASQDDVISLRPVEYSQRWVNVDTDVVGNLIVNEVTAFYVRCDLFDNVFVVEESTFDGKKFVFDMSYIEKCDHYDWWSHMTRQRLYKRQISRKLRRLKREERAAQARVYYKKRQKERKARQRAEARDYKRFRQLDILRRENEAYGLDLPDTPECPKKSMYSQRFDTSTINSLSDFTSESSLDDRSLYSQANGFASVWQSIDKANKVYTSVEDFKTTLASLKSTIAFQTKGEDEWLSNLIKRLEMIGLLFTGIASSSSVANLMSVIGLYIESWDEGPLGPKLYTLITSIFTTPSTGDGEKLHSQAAPEDEDPDVIEKELIHMRRLFDNWRELITCELAHKLANVVNILITAGFFPQLLRNADDLTIEQLKLKYGDDYRTPKNLKFAPCGIHLFAVKVWDVQKESVSFFDMLVDTTLFFLERGYAAFKYKDLSLLLHSDRNLCLMDKEYTILLTASQQLKIGTLDENPDMNGLSEYEFRLETLLYNVGVALKVSKTDHIRNTLTNRMVVLRRCRMELISHLKKSPVKEKPFGTLIYGASGIGKSTINAVLTKILLHANNLPNKKEHIVTLNANDEFQSELKSSHVAVLLDDWCNKKAEWHKMSPTDLLIQLLNNIPSAALSPIAENKGLIWPRPKLVTVTTNVKHLMAAHFSNEPASVLRRFELILDVKLKPDCVDPKTGTLDSSKCEDKMLPDCWDIDMQFVRIIPTKGNGPDGYEFVDVTPGRSVSLEEAVNICVDWSKVHYKKQAGLVKRTEEFFDMELCPHNRPEGTCVHCDMEKQLEGKSSEEVLEEALEAIPKVKDRLAPQCEDVAINPFDTDSVDTPREGTIVALPPLEAQNAEFPDQVTEVCRPVGKGVWIPPKPGFTSVLGPKEADYVPTRDVKFLIECGEIVEVEGQFYYLQDSLQCQAEENELNLFDRIRQTMEFQSEFVKKSYASEMDILRSYADASEEPEMKILEEDIMSDPGTEHVSLKHWCKRWYDDRKSSGLRYVKNAESTLTAAYAKTIGSMTTQTCAAIGIPVAALVTIKMFQYLRRTNYVTHSDVAAPVPAENDISNSFKQVIPNKIPLSEESTTSDHNDLVRLAGKHMGYARITNMTSNTSFSCCCFPLKGNVWLFPTHVFHPDADHTISVRTGGKEHLGQSFTQNVSKKDMKRVGPDLYLVSLRAGGSVKDFSKFLVEEDWKLKQKISGYLVVKLPDGSVKDIFGKVTRKKEFSVNGGAINFQGIGYQMEEPTKVGYCMAPFIPAAKHSTILGFHLAGDGEVKTNGVAGLLFRGDFDEAYEDLRDRGLVAHSEGTFAPNTYGIDVGYSTNVAKVHSVCKILDDCDEAHVRVVGSHTRPTMTFRSRVKKSPISKKLEEHLKIKRDYGAPDPRDFRKHYARDIDQMAKTKGNFKPSVMDKAEEDLSDKFREYLNSHPEALKLVHPYPKETILSGCDGIGSVDRLVQSTSMGFPVNAPKSRFMEEVDDVYPNIADPVDFTDPQYWQEVERMESELLAGNRINVVFRANLKDEPVKFDKEKIRVFAGCPVAFTCLVRKYFLSIVRLMQNDPLQFECAIGVNAHSRQWSGVARKLCAFGTKRMVAGDYKAYDKSVTCDTLMRSFRVLIGIAEQAGYTKDQITIMRGIATEISSPLYEIDGAFLMMFGSNPSGHPLTVIINNIFNTLYMRYAYYHMHDNNPPCPFDEAVSLVCYGDDNAMSVSEDEHLFNHTSVSTVLAECGVTYTMADKETESIPFIDFSEVSFLKRYFRWDDDMCEWTAPLFISSIGKSIHNYTMGRRCQLLPEELCAQTLQSAAREFFHYGKNEYESRCLQLQQAAAGTAVEKFMDPFLGYEELRSSFLSATGLKMIVADEFSDSNLSSQ